MLLDHINIILFDKEFFILSLLGRFAFPLFAYMLVKNVLFYSKNIDKYAFRLFIFALISQPVYMYVFNSDFIPMNIFFSLVIALYFVKALEKKDYLLMIITVISSLYSEYSIFSLLFVYALYFMFKEPFKNRRYVYILITLCLLGGVDYISVVPFIFFILYIAYEVELRLGFNDLFRKIINFKIDRTSKYKLFFLTET